MIVIHMIITFYNMIGDHDDIDVIRSCKSCVMNDEHVKIVIMNAI